MIAEGLIKLDSPEDFFLKNKKTISDPVIKWYISGLAEELTREKS